MTAPDTSTKAVTALLDGVTPGPWREFIDDSGDKWTGWPLSIYCDAIDDKTIVRTGGQWPYEWDAKTSQFEACANARFIAAARELVPALLAERDYLAKSADRAVARMRKAEDERDAAIARADRAKAEGMREAAEIAHRMASTDANMNRTWRAGCEDVAEAIHRAADKLEGKK